MSHLNRVPISTFGSLCVIASVILDLLCLYIHSGVIVKATTPEVDPPSCTQGLQPWGFGARAWHLWVGFALTSPV